MKVTVILILVEPQGTILKNLKKKLDELEIRLKPFRPQHYENRQGY